MKINLSRISKITALLTIFFAADKAIGMVRQVVIVRQFGLSHELDVFNVANNFPDLLFALISGGALAMAFIPILAQTITIEGRESAWNLFSQIANLAFLVTLVVAIPVALMSDSMVQWQVGIAPGFERPQQMLVAELMRLNLIATIIFSISGLVMAGLQANQHFLLPAAAPLLYNVGQIFGALILSPDKGYAIGSITLPAFGLGVHGLVYGVIFGALLHLAIQIPGLLKFGYRWKPILDLKDKAVQQVLSILGPRLLTMFCIQLIFIVRDNLASRLETGSVSALTYGWMFFQLPETLIGTAIGTAMLPSLAEHAARQDWSGFSKTIEKAVQTLIVLTLPVSFVLGTGLSPIISSAFHFDPQQSDLIMWVTRGYLLGLAGQSVLEVAVRSFYARKDAKTPLIAAAINLVVYSVLAIILSGSLGATGISVSESLAFTSEAILLLIILNHRVKNQSKYLVTIPKGLAGGIIGMIVTGGVMYLLSGVTGALYASIIGLLVGGLSTLPVIWKELRLITRL